MARHAELDRRLLLGLGAGAAIAAATGARAAAVLGDDGNYAQDWYLDSFLDLAEDAEAAQAEGKRFAVQWSMRGCPACKRLHAVYFANPNIETFVRAKFELVHLDAFGSREATDVDGERLSEKAMAAKRGVRTTPTFQFFAPRDGKWAEVARMPGLLAEPEFLAMFRFVTEGAYAEGSFEDWLRKRRAG